MIILGIKILVSINGVKMFTFNIFEKLNFFKQIQNHSKKIEY